LPFLLRRMNVLTCKSPNIYAYYTLVILAMQPQ